MGMIRIYVYVASVSSCSDRNGKQLQPYEPIPSPRDVNPLSSECRCECSQRRGAWLIPECRYICQTICH